MKFTNFPCLTYCESFTAVISASSHSFCFSIFSKSLWEDSISSAWFRVFWLESLVSSSSFSKSFTCKKISFSSVNPKEMIILWNRLVYIDALKNKTQKKNITTPKYLLFLCQRKQIVAKELITAITNLNTWRFWKFSLHVCKQVKEKEWKGRLYVHAHHLDTMRVQVKEKCLSWYLMSLQTFFRNIYQSQTES